MGCFSTPKCEEPTSGVPRYSTLRGTTVVASRDSNFSLLSNKPVELPDPRTLLEGTKRNRALKPVATNDEPVASVCGHGNCSEQLNHRAGRRTAFSGPLVYNNVAMADSSRASANYFSSDDGKRSYTGLRTLRRASSFGGRPQPLPLPADEKTPAREGKQMCLPLPAPEDAPTHSGTATSRTTSSFKLDVDAAATAGSRISRRGRVAPVGGLPLPPPSVASKLMPSLPAFEFRDLMLATDDFADSSCLEKGDFGAVFSARLKDPSESIPDAKIDATVLRLPENPAQVRTPWPSTTTPNPP